MDCRTQMISNSKLDYDLTQDTHIRNYLHNSETNVHLLLHFLLIGVSQCLEYSDSTKLEEA